MSKNSDFKEDCLFHNLSAKLMYELDNFYIIMRYFETLEFKRPHFKIRILNNGIQYYRWKGNNL